MKAVLLVAARELRQVLSTRGFWIMLLIVPLAIAVSAFASRKLGGPPKMAFTVVDASGRFGPALEKQLELSYQQRVLRGLSTYVDRWKLAGVDPNAPWARRGSWLSPAEVARFVAQGGADAAIATLTPKLPEGTPAFKPPERGYVEVPPPASVPTDQGAAAFGKAITGPLQRDIETSDGKRQYALALYIPKNYGTPGVTAEIWANGRSNNVLLGEIRDILTSELRLGMLEANGLSPAVAVRAQTISAPIAVHEPPPGQGRSIISTKSIVPLVLVYLLLITSITIGSMMLQGVIEERSNKLLESVLACIEPSALMQGKLLGLGGVGLAIILVWAGCALGAGFSSPSFSAEFLRPSLQAIDDPIIVAAMIFYFLSGYLIMAMVFLAIGSLSDSTQDAQSYLMPVLVVIMLPVIMVMQASIQNPDQILVHVMSWIPFYTPFAMLARLGNGVPLWELAGTAALLIVFLFVELVFLGRLFQASLLSSGKPGWHEIFAKLRILANEVISTTRRPFGPDQGERPMICFRTLLCALAVLLAASMGGSAMAATGDNALGDWHGVLATPRGNLTIVVTVKKDDAGALKAELESVDQAPGVKIPMSSFSVTDSHMSFAISRIQASYEGDWDAAGQQWKGTFHQGADLPLTLSKGLPAPKPVIEGLDGRWEGTIDRNGTKLRLVLRITTGPQGTNVVLDSPDQLARGIPVQDLSRDGSTVRLHLNQGNQSYEGQLSADGKTITGTWTSAIGEKLPLTFSHTSDTAARKTPERPQTPKPPFDYKVEEVAFDNPVETDVHLAGTLTLPKGKGPFPAAILITGSGAQNRDETILGHKPFAVIADHLTKHGIAVLRYDDRGVGGSKGDYAAATSADSRDRRQCRRRLPDDPARNPPRRHRIHRPFRRRHDRPDRDGVQQGHRLSGDAGGPRHAVGQAAPVAAPAVANRSRRSRKEFGSGRARSRVGLQGH